ncbi:Membrane protein involved in colicin uptake-like protein [Minicystis rosea]|nr:Membrane protein involved in colicin uptake-like protein [Minicystis rosea]
MKDRDALADALGRALQKAPEAEDPRWEELAQGDLAPDAIDALLEASPLDAAQEEALLARALAPANVRPLRSSRPRRTWALLALAAAFAAFAAFVILRPHAPTPPTCALDAKGDAVALGPDTAAPDLVVSPGTRVRLTLTPSSPVPEDLVARFFLASGQEVRPLPIHPAPARTVRLEGLREEVFPNVPAGRYDLIVVIAYAGTNASDSALADMARNPDHPPPGFRVVRRSIELRGGPLGSVVPVPKEVQEATSLRAEGKLDEAEAKLATAPPGLARDRLTARLSLDRGRAEEAAKRLQDAIAAGRAVGDVEGTGKDVLALAYVQLEAQRDAAMATRTLEDATDILSAWPAGTAYARYTRAQVARARGDLRVALANLREVMHEAELVGLDVTRDQAREMACDLLSTLGRHTEALAIVRAISLPASQSCRAAEARNNAAWIEIRAARAGASGNAKRAVALLEDALAVVRSGCPAWIGKVLTNLAIARIEAGDRLGALAAAAEAERSESTADPGDVVWWEQIRADAELGNGRPEKARHHFEKARALGELHHLPEAVLAGTLGAALTYDAANDIGGARRAFDAAALALDAWARAAPLGEGRGLFLAEHARATRLHAAFLLRRDKPESALLAARRGAARYFALLDRPDAALAEPSALAAGNAFLATVSLSEGTVGLMQVGDRVTRAPLPTSSFDTWLSSFAAALHDAKRLYLPASGFFRDIDVHAAPLDGRPLVAHLPVAYTLDLPQLDAPPRLSSPVALIVADPSRDLPAVRATLAPLRAAFEAQGLRVVMLEGDAATREAFRGAITSPDIHVLHYAGHASFAGQDGLDAALALADGPFSVRDILALGHVPPHAILLGCSSAGTDPGADSLGLAQAFLVKGTLSAIAARVDLDATVVEALGARLAVDLGSTPDLPAALARAQAALAVERPALRWSALRALVR